MRTSLAVAWVFGSLNMLEVSRAGAQGNEVDPVFGGASLGLVGNIRGIGLLPDGKVLVGGGSRGLVRLNSDGSTDTTFRAGLDDALADQNLGLVAVLANGKILISGNSTPGDETVRNYLTRLNADGSPDSGFHLTVDKSFGPVAMQDDGKILIGGIFTQVNGTARRYLARLNSDGSVDTSFNAPSLNESVHDIAVQHSGAIIVNAFTRLKPNGSADASFKASDNFYGGGSATVQADDKILIGGQFTSQIDLPGYPIRLNADGSVDTHFVASTAVAYDIVVQMDGKILIGGFNQNNDKASDSVARLNKDGSLDKTFNVDAYPGPGCGVVQAGEKLYIAGYFNQVNGTPRNSVARLYADGTLDAGFVPDTASGPNARVRGIALLPNGKVVIAGDFTQVNGAAHRRVARLNADASPDTAFQTSVSEGLADELTSVNGVVAQADGKLLIYGGFNSVNGTFDPYGVKYEGLARLNADGSLDTGFLGTVDNTPTGVIVQPDGKILLCGLFNTVDGGTAYPHLARLKTDGSLDTAFKAGTRAVSTFALQPDGNLLVSHVLGARNQIDRLKPDGTQDVSFNAQAAGGSGDAVSCLALQPDGKILLGGGFTTVDGTARTGVARLNANGTLDATFAASANGVVRTIAVRPDGRIVLGGDFTQVNGVAHAHLARLDADGSLDPFANLGRGTSGSVDVLALQTGGAVFLGGGFSSVDGSLRNYVAKLKAAAAADFFSGQVAVGGGFYYLEFPGGSPFGYYNLQGNGYGFPFVYHNDLGMEYFFDAQDGQGGAYFYDFASRGFFYTSPSFPFPYLYDFSLNSVVYYYPDPDQAGHYNTDGNRFFYVFNTRQIIVK